LELWGGGESEVAGELVEVLGVGVASHEAEAGDGGGVGCEEGVEGGRVEGGAGVGAEVGAVAALAMVGALGEVEGEGGFAGDFAEHDVIVVQS
jgi:hypothetical protein